MAIDTNRYSASPHLIGSQASVRLCQEHLEIWDAFMRLGEPATAYYEGLRKQRRAAAGYHLQRILKFADRYGSDVVAGALAYMPCVMGLTALTL